MNSREYDRRPFGFQLDAAGFHDAERASQQRFRGDGAKADDDLRFHQRDLVLEPGKAGANLSEIWGFMEATLRPRILCPLEVLDGVREVQVIAIDARRVERAIEDFPRRADERVPRALLDVARLLADHHHAGPARTFAEHRLTAREQVAAATSLCR